MRTDRSPEISWKIELLLTNDPFSFFPLFHSVYIYPEEDSEGERRIYIIFKLQDLSKY